MNRETNYFQYLLVCLSQHQPELDKGDAGNLEVLQIIKCFWVKLFKYMKIIDLTLNSSVRHKKNQYLESS